MGNLPFVWYFLAMKFSSLGVALRNQLILQTTAVVVFSIVVLGVVSIHQKREVLRDNLTVGSQTIASSLEAADWDLAIGHLSETAAATKLHSFELFETNGVGRILGPIGDKQIGIGQICQRAQLPGGSFELAACSTLLTTDMLGFLLLTAFFYFLACTAIFRITQRTSREILDKMNEEIRFIAESLSGTKTETTVARLPEFYEIHQSILRLLEKVKSAQKHEDLALLGSQISHDLRSPLSAIKIGISYLDSNREQAERLISEGSKAINDLCEEMLCGYRQAKKQVGQLPDGITNINHELSNFVENKKVQFSEVDLSLRLPDRGTLINLSPGITRRILENVLNNSIEARASEKRLEIKIDVTSDKEQCQLRFSDNGRGIPSEVLSRVFETGFTFGKKTGTGLGLGFVATVVKENGGTIEIESKKDVGTSLTISMPVVSV